MDGYITFSQLNDFLFCPHSLYIHECYRPYSTALYHDQPQVAGKLAHGTIDQNNYNKSDWITGMWLCSPSLRICGRADLFNPKTGELIERKRLIRRIYPGQLMQIWAQWFCLEEMGHPVHGLAIHSLADNSRYPLDSPTPMQKESLRDLIDHIFAYNPSRSSPLVVPAKCASCIYSPLCPYVVTV